MSSPTMCPGCQWSGDMMWAEDGYRLDTPWSEEQTLVKTQSCRVKIQVYMSMLIFDKILNI